MSGNWLRGILRINGNVYGTLHLTDLVPIPQTVRGDRAFGSYYCYAGGAQHFLELAQFLKRVEVHGNSFGDVLDRLFDGVATARSAQFNAPCDILAIFKLELCCEGDFAN